MLKILDYARERGVRPVFGEILAQNRTMLQMTRELGFVTRRSAEPSDTVTVELDLAEAAAHARLDAG